MKRIPWPRDKLPLPTINETKRLSINEEIKTLSKTSAHVQGKIKNKPETTSTRPVTRSKSKEKTVLLGTIEPTKADRRRARKAKRVRKARRRSQRRMKKIRKEARKSWRNSEIEDPDTWDRKR